MNATLTLDLDAAVVERAKRISAQQGKSLNALVEDYLNQLSIEAPKSSFIDEMISIVRDEGVTAGSEDYDTLIKEGRYRDWLDSQPGTSA